MAPNNINTNEVLDPRSLVQRVADQALEVVAAAEGVLVGLTDEGGLTYICGAGFLKGDVGTTVKLGSSLAGVAAITRDVVCSDDTSTDPRVDAEACRRLGVASSVCVPLCRSGEVLGVMAVSATRPHAFSAADIALLGRLADFLGVAVGLAGDLGRVSADLFNFGRSADAGMPSPVEPSPGAASQTASSRMTALPGTDEAPADDDARVSAGRFVMSVLRPEAVSWMEARSRVQAILDNPGQLSVVFQPIVDLVSDRVVAVEALSRFHTEPLRGPHAWFADAQHCGLAAELESLAVTKALAYRTELPSDIALSVNVGPGPLSQPELLDVLASVCGGNIVLELTEHTRCEDYDGLLRELGTLRQAGARLSVDDAGAGFSGLSHILKLAPDFIKLDRELVRGVDVDPVRRALTASLVSFAADTGAEIIAEGVETSDELEAVRSLGVRFAQGFCLGRPGQLGPGLGGLGSLRAAANSAGRGT